MGDFVFVVLVLGGLGVFFYRQSQEKQAQRSAADAQQAPVVSQPTEESVEPATPVEQPEPEEEEEKEAAVDVKETPAADAGDTEEQPAKEGVAQGPSQENYDALTWRVLQRVMEQPGIMQTEIYGLFPKENRKHLQATLLQLDKENVLRREKEGNSYRLFPV